MAELGGITLFVEIARIGKGVAPVSSKDSSITLMTLTLCPAGMPSLP
jgi:hypothetical protein